MKKLLILSLLLSVFFFSGCENQDDKDYIESLENELSDLQAKLDEANDCSYRLNEKLSTAEDSVSYVSSELGLNLEGDYYDLYNTIESAKDDLEMIDFYETCY